MITVLDYGAGNLKSITNMLEALCEEYILTDKPENVAAAQKIIFPGQGHFGAAMQSLEQKGLKQPLIDAVNSGVPFLGVCVGMQLLFENSEEAPDIKGLGIFKGSVKKFTEGKIPQIGWNQLKTTQNNSCLEDDYYYFVNSYYVAPENPDIVSAYCNYHIDFVAAVEYKNITAMQFHPEKSGEVGYRSIKKWLDQH